MEEYNRSINVGLPEPAVEIPSVSPWLIMISTFVCEAVWPGLGLLGESYMLFSLGLLTPLWKLVFADTYNTAKISQLIGMLPFWTVAGLISGMLLMGYQAQFTGRRMGSIITASLMCAGGWGMTSVACLAAFKQVRSVPHFILQLLSVSLFILGFGVGGEYPLAAASASEQAMSQQQQQRHRGCHVQLVFSMQGVGIFCNSLFLTFLLYVTGQNAPENYNINKLVLVWQITYAVGATILSAVLVTRIRHLQESKVWQQSQYQQTHWQYGNTDTTNTKTEPCNANETNHLALAPGVSVMPCNLSVLVIKGSNRSMQEVPEEISSNAQTIETLTFTFTTLLLVYRHYGSRLLGVSTCWFLWDIAFYGNKLFQSVFLLALTGKNEATLVEFSAAATINAFVALLGYWGAAWILDQAGRRNLQQWGLLVTGVLFVSVGFLLERLPAAGLAILYLGSSFFGQLGPNATTFLLPSELFPTQLRTFCHGIAAACGKFGALTATASFPYFTNDSDLFIFAGYTSFLAAAVTCLTIPETVGLELQENDLKWNLILQDKASDYKGQANHPLYLSYFEKWHLQPSLHI